MNTPRIVPARAFQTSLMLAVLSITLCCTACGPGQQQPEQRFATEPPVYSKIVRESRERPDMLDENSPEGLKVIQVTTDPFVRSHNVYTEIKVFTPDSRKFVFIRERNFWLCDIDDGYSLRQITDEPGAQAPSVSADGLWMYYFVDRTSSYGGELILKRVSLTDFTRQTLMELEGPLPGTDFRPNGYTTLSSISSDGKRLCIAAFVGNDGSFNAPFGLLVFDLEKITVDLVFTGREFHNAHPQYCLSTDPEMSHDIMLQHNHGDSLLPTGRCVRSVTGREGDLHVIRDDGTNWRDIPVGRDSVQFIQGHEQWLGRTGKVLSAMSIRQGPQKGRRPIFLASPVPTGPESGHLGVNTPGGDYVDITRSMENPDFWHFSSDLSGKYLASDTWVKDEGMERPEVRLVAGTLSEGDRPELRVRHLIHTGSSGRNPAHPHPFFSPDNSMILFNSDIDGQGQVQVFMVTGFEFP